VSYYGSDFNRALLLLLLLILCFGISYAPLVLLPRNEPSATSTTSAVPAVPSAPVSAASVAPAAKSQSAAERIARTFRHGFRALGAGLLLSLEISTFQRDRSYEFAQQTRWISRPLTILQTILIPAQLAIFLLALRRRFRH
jgi:hypothetical protein